MTTMMTTTRASPRSITVLTHNTRKRLKLQSVLFSYFRFFSFLTILTRSSIDCRIHANFTDFTSLTIIALQPALAEQLRVADNFTRVGSRIVRQSTFFRSRDFEKSKPILDNISRTVTYKFKEIKLITIRSTRIGRIASARRKECATARTLLAIGRSAPVCSDMKYSPKCRSVTYRRLPSRLAAH